MAYYFNKGTDERQEQFIVDTVGDISKLPTSVSEGDKSKAMGKAYKKVAVGSVALCISTGDLYILNSNNEWTKVGG